MPHSGPVSIRDVHSIQCILVHCLFAPVMSALRACATMSSLDMLCAVVCRRGQVACTACPPSTLRAQLQTCPSTAPSPPASSSLSTLWGASGMYPVYYWPTHLLLQKHRRSICAWSFSLCSMLFAFICAHLSTFDCQSASGHAVC